MNHAFVSTQHIHATLHFTLRCTASGMSKDFQLDISPNWMKTVKYTKELLQIHGRPVYLFAEVIIMSSHAEREYFLF